jgi:hypothetical protein
MAETKNAQTPDPKSNPSPKPSPKPNLSALPFLSNANGLPFLDKSKGTTLPEVTVTSSKKNRSIRSVMEKIKSVQDAENAELNALGEYATRNTKYDRALINQQFNKPTPPNTITNTREAIQKKWEDNANKAAALKVVDEYDAINNTIDAYIKKQGKFNSVFNESTKKFEDVDPYSHPDVISKRKELEYGLQTGQFELTKDELTGASILAQTYDNPFFALSESLKKGSQITLEHRDFLSLTREEKVKRIQYENAFGPSYLPLKATGVSKATQFIGDVTMPLLKAATYGIGAATIGRVMPSAGATMTAETIASLKKFGTTVSFIEDMSQSGAVGEIKETYNRLMQNDPKMDPLKAMEIAEMQGNVGAAVGSAEAILMGTSFSKLLKPKMTFKGIEQASSTINTVPFMRSMLNSYKGAIKQFAPVVKESTKIGGISAAGSVAKDVSANAFGADIPIEKTFEDSFKSFEEGFKMVFSLGALPAGAKAGRMIAETIPFVRDVNARNISIAVGISTGALKGINPSVGHQAFLVAKELPSVEVEGIIKAGEREGVFEQGTFEKFESDKKLFEETDAQVPTDIPKEKRDIIRGIQVKINKLDKMSSKLGKDSPFFERVEKMKEEYNNKAIKVLESDNPLEADAVLPSTIDEGALKETPKVESINEVDIKPITLNDLKDFDNLPNIRWAIKGNSPNLYEFGIDLTSGKETLKSVSNILSNVKGPYQAIFKAISSMPGIEKVSVVKQADPYMVNRITGGGVGGGFYPGKNKIDVNTIYSGQYLTLAHEALHWVTIDSINQYRNTPEYNSLRMIYEYVLSKKSDRIPKEGTGGRNYGLANIKEFFAELIVDKDFRDGISDVIANKEEFNQFVKEFERAEEIKESSLDARADLITILVRYVTRVIKDLMKIEASGKQYAEINFDKSMLDNSTELAIRAFFEGPANNRKAQPLSKKGEGEILASEQEPINEQNKPTENATPIGQEPGKKIGTEGNIGEPTRTEGVKEQETPKANVGDSNIGGKAKPKVEAPKLEVEPEKETPKEFNNNETATVFGKMKKAAEEYLSKKTDDFSGASRKALSTLKNSAFYKGLDKNEREKYVVAATKFFEGKRPPSPQVQRLLGTSNNATTTVNNMAALKTQLKLQAKAAKDAVMWVKGTRKSISNGLNELKKKGVIKTPQFLSILKKYDSLNMSNKAAIDKFTSYVTKVINDANYSDKLSRANRFKGLIKKAASAKGKQVNLVAAAREFLNINPADIENIDEYISKANEVLNGVRSSRAKGKEVNFSEAFKDSDILDYVKNQSEKIEESKKQSKLDDYNELVEDGTISKDMTLDQINEIVKLIEEKKDSDVPDIENKKNEIKSYIKKRFESLSGEVDSMLKDIYFSYNISAADKKRLNDIMDLGIDDLPIKDSYVVIEALGNFAANGKMSNLDSAIAVGEAYRGGRILESKGIKSLTIKGIFGKRVAQTFAADMTSLPVLFDKAFGTNKSLEVQKAMGISSLMRNKTMAEKIYEEASKEYTDKFVGKYGGLLKSKTNPNGLRFDAKENIYERGMLAIVRRNMGGGEAAIAKEFNRRKALLQETIVALRGRGGDYAKMADLYQTSFDKLVKDSNSLLDVESKADAINLEANNWWINEWGKHYGKMKDVNLNIYNQDLGFHNNYIPDTYVKFDKNETPTSGDPLTENPFFSSYDYIPDAKSGTLMKTSNPEILPNGKFIDLDFDYNNNRALKTALINIYTAKDLRQVKAFRDSPFFEKIFNSEDGDVFKGKISTYAKRIQNKDIAASRELSQVGRSLSVAATTAVSTALSSFAQPFKQLAPIAHTFIANNGKLEISDALSADAHDWLNRIGYGISNRGMGSQFNMESVSSMLRKADNNALTRGITGLGKIQEAKLRLFVGYSDIFTARLSWLSYYKQKLRKQGEDVSNLDWNTHEINKDAADFAEQMTNVSQNVSDTDLQGTFIGSQDPYHKLFKNTVMTLANYTMNQKAKIGGNIRVALGKGVAAEDRGLAVKSLAGTAAEMFVYNAVWQMANNIQWGIADKMSNTTPSQEEKRRRALSSKKTTITNLTNDLISPHPIFNDGIDKMVNLALEKIDPNTPKAFEVRLYDGGGQDAWAKNYGVGGILLKNIMDASRYNDVAISGEVKTEDPFGEEQVKKLTGDDKKIAMSWMPLTILGRTLGFSDMANISNKIIKNISARGMSEEKALINEAIGTVPVEEEKPTILDSKTINQAAAEAIKFKDPESRAKYLLDLKKKYGDDLWSKEMDLISSPKAGIIDGGTIAFMTAMINNDQDAMKVYKAFSLDKAESKVESLMRTRQEIGADRFFKKIRSALDFKMLNGEGIKLLAEKLDAKDLDKLIKIYSEFSKQEQDAKDAEEEAARLEEQQKAMRDALGQDQ